MQRMIIDVREPEEYAICKIEQARLIPLQTLAEYVGNFDKTASYVICCKAGGRSAAAVSYFKQQGFGDVKNLTGGMMSWVQEIDPTLSKYW